MTDAMMSLARRLRRRRPPPPKADVPAGPLGFCQYCGEPMVDGYLIAGDAYDKATGRPTRAIIRGVLCSTQNRRRGGSGGTSKPSVIPAIHAHTGVWELIYGKAEYVWREDAPA